jgi:hypothetical protein
MYYPARMMTLPPDHAKIWRYTDLTKLLAVLDSHALYFACVRSMDDPYEAYIRYPTFEEYLVEANADPECAKLTPEQLRQCYHECYHSRDVRNDIFVNCWHANEYESAAMWKLYLSSTEGVAIQSTVGRLIRSLEKSEDKILVGLVKYIDYETTGVGDNVYHRTIHKRKSFAHEQELRAIMHRESPVEPQKPGYNVRVDVDTLIERIYVAPTCPSYVRPVVESVVKKFGLSKEVIQ